MTDQDETTIPWGRLPKDEDGTPFLEFGGERYRLPYLDLIPQNVSVDSLRESIRENGIEYPIIVDQDDNVIDGMTRLYIADDLGLSPDDVPVEREEIADDEKGWQMAIELNAVRRQISGPMRRQLVEEIVDRKNWRKPSSHVTDLANMLGVHKSTISRDITKLYGPDEIEKLKKRKRMLNVSLTGMRNVGRMIDGDEILTDSDNSEKSELSEMVYTLIDAVEAERERITEEIDEAERK